MADPKKTLEELGNLMNYAQGQLVDKKSFTKFVEALVTLWKRLNNAVMSEITMFKQEVSNKLDTTTASLKQAQERQRSDLLQKLASDREYNRKQLENTVNRLASDLGYLEDRIDEPVDFSDIYSQIGKMREQIPQEYDPSEIVEKIQELENRYEELEKRKPVVQATNHSIVGRDIIKDIDLSGDLDGATKTFNIQAVYNIVSVNLSSYPYGSLRKGIDYTHTDTSITFTDEIAAATQLATGQKCILTVVQA